MRFDLSKVQLEITMHLANGKTFSEIAEMLDRSISYVKQNANQARYRVNARTLPQLVSIVIESGQLEWYGDQRRLNGLHPAQSNGNNLDAAILEA